jgi:hypothetical protein
VGFAALFEEDIEGLPLLEFVNGRFCGSRTIKLMVSTIVAIKKGTP